MGDADVNGLGILETYQRKLAQVSTTPFLLTSSHSIDSAAAHQARPSFLPPSFLRICVLEQLKTSFPDVDLTTEDNAKDVLKKLIVDPATRLTGEQGGKLLACYLYSLDDRSSGSSWGAVLRPSFLSIGVVPFLQKQLAKLSLFPTCKSLLEEAVKFYPQLVQGLETARAAQAASVELDFSDDGNDDGAVEGGLDFGDEVHAHTHGLLIGPRRPPAVGPTAAHRAIVALPLRTGGIAQSSFSRDAIRSACMASLAASHNYSAVYQAPSIAPAFSEKPARQRGRTLNMASLRGGLDMVNAQVRTSSFREHSAPLPPVVGEEGGASEGWDEDVDEEPEGMRDLRSMPPPRGALQLPARGRWQRDWPAEAPAAAIVRWRVSAFSSGRWYEGFIFRYRRQPAAGAMGFVDCVQVYYDETEEEEWFSMPEPSLVFNASQASTARVSATRRQEACKAYDV
jgi:hypothetical protein